MRSSDGSSDVCSSDLISGTLGKEVDAGVTALPKDVRPACPASDSCCSAFIRSFSFSSCERCKSASSFSFRSCASLSRWPMTFERWRATSWHDGRSEEHTSELQSLMRISYAVFCLTKKNHDILRQSAC